MDDTEKLIAILRSCGKPEAYPHACNLCPFCYEVQVEQFLYERRCACEDAAGELERYAKFVS